MSLAYQTYTLNFTPTGESSVGVSPDDSAVVVSNNNHLYISILGGSFYDMGSGYSLGEIQVSNALTNGNYLITLSYVGTVLAILYTPSTNQVSSLNLGTAWSATFTIATFTDLVSIVSMDNNGAFSITLVNNAGTSFYCMKTPVRQYTHPLTINIPATTGAVTGSPSAGNAQIVLSPNGTIAAIVYPSVTTCSVRVYTGLTPTSDPSTWSGGTLTNRGSMPNGTYRIISVNDSGDVLLATTTSPYILYKSTSTVLSTVILSSTTQIDYYRVNPAQNIVAKQPTIASSNITISNDSGLTDNPSGYQIVTSQSNQAKFKLAINPNFVYISQPSSIVKIRSDSLYSIISANNNSVLTINYSTNNISYSGNLPITINSQPVSGYKLSTTTVIYQTSASVNYTTINLNTISYKAQIISPYNLYKGNLLTFVAPLISTIGETAHFININTTFSLGTYDVVPQVITYYMTGKDSLGGMVWWSSLTYPDTNPVLTYPPTIGTLSGIRIVDKLIS